jgi:hypothetical protein
MAESREVVCVGPVKTWFDEEEGIIIATFEDGAEIGVEDARGCTRAMIQVSNGKPSPLLVDFTGLKSQSKECRDYFANDPTHVKTYVAVAILVTSPLSRIVANFFLGINKPIRPTKLFEDRALAIEWLRGYSAS